MWQISSWWILGFWHNLRFLGSCCQIWRLWRTVIFVGRTGTWFHFTSSWLLGLKGCFVDCCCYWCCFYQGQQAFKYLGKWTISLIVNTHPQWCFTDWQKRSHLNRLNLWRPRALVRISAMYWSVGRYSNWMTSRSRRSRTKWCLMSMCLLWLCVIGLSKLDRPVVVILEKNRAV